jgi:hypothetical protein
MVGTTERFSEEGANVLTRLEVANLLQPVIGQHHIEIKDDCFEFPDFHSFTEVPESELPDETKKTVILFEDIAAISPFEARVEVLLQCGELFIFSTTDSVKTHINTHSNKNMKSQKPITAQDVAGNIWDRLDDTLSKDRK